MNLKGENVAVVGYGISGKAIVNFLLKQGAKVTLYNRDNVEDDRFESYLETEELENGIDLVVVSPGVKQSHHLVAQAVSRGIPVRNDLTLFLDLWEYRGLIIGVTGSNGKSTTVTLIHKALDAAGVRNFLGGNIGLSPLDFYDQLKDGDIVVLEISSYQLELFEREHFADIAVITNITENHLDRYDGSWEEYVRAKMNILKPGVSKLIVEGDNEGIRKYVIPKVINNDIFEVTEDSVERFDNLNLIGKHNKLNVGVVYKILDILNIKSPEIDKAINSFNGLEHRIEKVRELNGVTYINDSKSTSVDATIKALESVTDKKNVVLILGGDNKGSKYDSLTGHIKDYVKKIILLPGKGEQEFLKLKDFVGDFELVDDLDSAVISAQKSAQSGDVVLLSPAAASLGYFKSFEDRGSQFKEKVLELRHDK